MAKPEIVAELVRDCVPCDFGTRNDQTVGGRGGIHTGEIVEVNVDGIGAVVITVWVALNSRTDGGVCRAVARIEVENFGVSRDVQDFRHAKLIAATERTPEVIGIVHLRLAGGGCDAIRAENNFDRDAPFKLGGRAINRAKKDGHSAEKQKETKRHFHGCSFVATEA